MRVDAVPRGRPQDDVPRLFLIVHKPCAASGWLRGGGFDVLGDTLDAALKTLQQRHITASGEARYLSAIVDDSPSALLAIDQNGKVASMSAFGGDFRPRGGQ